MEDRFADKFRIKSGRLRDWDYSDSGLYFVTICTLNHNKFFGKIEDGKMIYSKKGKLTYKCLVNIPIHFTNIKLINYVIMPNHVHILIEMKDNKFTFENRKEVTRKSRDVISESRDNEKMCRDVACYVSTHKKEKMSKISPKKNSISTIIRSYKSAVTKTCREQNLFFAWQSRYYDEIIFDKNRLKLIVKYIKNNPSNWEKDKLYFK